MYLARTTIERTPHFFIRHTYREGTLLKSRTVFDLGTDPARFIVYPGGNGYYFDQDMEEHLRSQGLNPTQDDLDRIFWDFLDPAVKRVIQGFQRNPRRSPGSEPCEETHRFDRRRIHYLRFGRSDQRDLDRLPLALYRCLDGKSRDEIEQHFLAEERILKKHELKKYVCTIFDLFPFIREMTRRFVEDPANATGQQEGIDHAFIEAICRLSRDSGFWRGTGEVPGLQEYLVRYVILYFDNEFPAPSPWRTTLHDFMNQHRTYRPPQKVRLSIDEAARLFETDWATLKQMDGKTFSRLYRRQAMKHHPDQGGDKQTFIRLTAIYKHLVQRKH